MKVGIIGAGKVGCSLAFALADRGVELSGVYSKSPGPVCLINEKLGKRLELGMKELVGSSGVIVITVPDSAISSVSAQISVLCSSEDIEGTIFLHCSGALASQVLWQLEDKGGLTGSLHPIQTFPDRENSWKAFFNIYFGFEGTKAAEEAASEIAGKLGGKLLVIKAEAKPLYHAAACMLSNYVAVLVHEAGSLLEWAGIDRDMGIGAFGPLFLSSAANIAATGSVKALTGPIARGDCITVEGHLAAIGSISPEAADLYRVLGRTAVQLALIKGSIGNDEAAALMEILK